MLLSDSGARFLPYARDVLDAVERARAAVTTRVPDGVPDTVRR